MPEHSNSASHQAVSVSKTAQASSIVIMLCGVNKALLAPLPRSQCSVSWRHRVIYQHVKFKFRSEVNRKKRGNKPVGNAQDSV